MFKRLFKIFPLLLLTTSAYAGTCSCHEGSCEQLGKILRGEASKVDNVCDIFAPRNLTSVINDFILNPQIGIGLEATFIPIKGSKKKAVDGEVALLEGEVQKATAFLKSKKFEIVALHNHYILENPKIMFLHFEKQDTPIRIANQLRELEDLLGGFNSSSSSSPSLLDAGALNRSLRLNGEIQRGGVLRADFQRPFKIDDNGAISEPQCMIAIQGTMGNALIVGEIALKTDEMQRFIKALLNNNLLLTAVHNHEVSEKPRVYYVHFQQSGQSAIALAQAARQALNTIQVENVDK